MSCFNLKISSKPSGCTTQQTAKKPNSNNSNLPQPQWGQQQQQSSQQNLQNKTTSSTNGCNGIKPAAAPPPGNSSIPAIIPINYEQLINNKMAPNQSHSTPVQPANQQPQAPPPSQQQQQRVNHDIYNGSIPPRSSSKPPLNHDVNSSCRNGSNPSPNAVLYQKLLELVSTSADLANQSELSTQMSTLLSNPNIKARLKQLHTQLLKDPNEYWPKLENILLDDSKLQKQIQKDQIKITQDLIDLKNFYSREYFSNDNSNNSINNSTMTSNNCNNINNSSYYAKTQPRIINREHKK